MKNNIHSLRGREVTQQSLRTATPSTVREVNRSIILNLIRLHQPVSRAELSERTGIFRSNVSDIVGQLIRQGLLNEKRAIPAGRGRVPILLSLNAHGLQVLGVNVRPLQTSVALAGLTGEAHHALTFDTPQQPRALIRKLSRLVRDIRKQYPGKFLSALQELGISVPGMVHSDTGRILWLPLLPEYSGFELARELEKETGIPTAVENDSNLAAMAELWLDEADGLKDFVVLAVGDFGVGAGIVLNRELYRGHDSTFAGEFGHMTVDPTGPKCSCGRSGCWELYITDRATWRRYESRAEFEPSRFQGMIRAAREGSKRACDAFRETARFLSAGISNIFVGLNPEVIIVAGRITQAWDLIWGTVDDTFSSADLKVPIRTARLEAERLYLYGAIRLALNKAFAKPKLGW